MEKLKLRKYSGEARYGGLRPVIYCRFKLTAASRVESIYVGKSIWGWSSRYTGLMAVGQTSPSSSKVRRGDLVHLVLCEHEGNWEEGLGGITDDHLLTIEHLTATNILRGPYRSLLTTDKTDVGAGTRLTADEYRQAEAHARRFTRKIRDEIRRLGVATAEGF